jgi:hypothetical protein
MTKRGFNPAERYAVFTVHGEKCYMCTCPLDLWSMQVDHVIPETLVGTPELVVIIAEYGLLPDFDLQSFENWLPSCSTCNNRKKDRVLRKTIRFQLDLEIAAGKAPAARALAKTLVSKQSFSRAWNTILRAVRDHALSSVQLKDIEEFARFHAQHRSPAMAREPIQFAPFIQVLAEQHGLRVVKGPYGVGAGPAVSDVSDAMRCSCGSPYFMGARCVICGQMDGD